MSGYFSKRGEILSALDDHESPIRSSVNLLLSAVCNAVSNNKKILVFGNGVAISQSLHFSYDISSLIAKSKMASAVIPIGAPLMMSADHEGKTYPYYLANHIEATGRLGDTAIAIVHSGFPQNVANAIRVAKTKGVFTSVICGRDSENMAIELAQDIQSTIMIPSDDRSTIEEITMSILHFLSYKVGEI